MKINAMKKEFFIVIWKKSYKLLILNALKNKKKDLW
jgi:hypothetical protein